MLMMIGRMRGQALGYFKVDELVIGEGEDMEDLELKRGSISTAPSSSI